MLNRRLPLLFLPLVALAATCAIAPRSQAGGPQTLFQWYYEEDTEEKSKLDEPLVTDRPDFTEASTTVGQGVVQLEMGYTFTGDSSGGERTGNHSFPETLWRIGILADWLEFRIQWNYDVERTRGVQFSDTQWGADDLYLGFKIALTEQQGCLPEVAIIPQMTVPTGGDAFTANQVLPGFNLCYSWDLNEEWSLAGSSGLNSALDDITAGTFSEIHQSFSLGRSWSEHVGSYTEWFVIAPDDADTNRPEHYFDAGITYLPTKNIQWDIRAGVGLNEAADNYFVGSGLSLRFY